MRSPSCRDQTRRRASRSDCDNQRIRFQGSRRARRRRDDNQHSYRVRRDVCHQVRGNRRIQLQGACPAIRSL